MRQIYLLRGLPGSGKSHWVQTKLNNPVVCSADDYFIVDGVYCHDASLLDEAHTESLKKFIKALINEESPIVVDNTNICVWEMAPYVQLAKTFWGRDFELILVNFIPDLQLCLERQTHGVPERIMLTMYSNFVSESGKIPPHWNAKIQVM